MPWESHPESAERPSGESPRLPERAGTVAWWSHWWTAGHEDRGDLDPAKPFISVRHSVYILPNVKVSVERMAWV